MDHGKITEVGTYAQLVEDGEAFSKFLEEYANKPETEKGEDNEEKKQKRKKLRTARKSI